MTRLHDLFDEQGQSPWLDNLRRGWLHDGELARWVEAGVRGITSNPSIFQKAIEGSADYDEQFAALVAQNQSTETSYWELVVDDIRGALALLRPVSEATDGLDGYVSVEVSPVLAHDTAGTMSAARHLDDLLDAPNLYVKIPGTIEGLPAIQQMIAEGRSINVTLLFSCDRYDAVIEAYLAGLESFVASGASRSAIAATSSVASFFISRVDTEVDRRLEAIGTQEALALRGRAAVANAQLAYQRFLDRFSGPRWDALAAAGARVQRPLWASTSTKNSAFPDTLYVDALIGPHSVNTIPDSTLAAFVDHGTVARTVDVDPSAAQTVFDQLAAVGIDFDDVARVLEAEGVAAFVKSFDELLFALDTKANELRAGA